MGTSQRQPAEKQPGAFENPGQSGTRLRDYAHEYAKRVESVYRQEPEPGDDRDDKPSL